MEAGKTNKNEANQKRNAIVFDKAGSLLGTALKYVRRNVLTLPTLGVASYQQLRENRANNEDGKGEFWKLIRHKNSLPNVIATSLIFMSLLESTRREFVNTAFRDSKGKVVDTGIQIKPETSGSTPDITNQDTGVNIDIEGAMQATQELAKDPSSARLFWLTSALIALGVTLTIRTLNKKFRPVDQRIAYFGEDMASLSQLKRYTQNLQDLGDKTINTYKQHEGSASTTPTNMEYLNSKYSIIKDIDDLLTNLLKEFKHLDGSQDTRNAFEVIEGFVNLLIKKHQEISSINTNNWFSKNFNDPGERIEKIRTMAELTKEIINDLLAVKDQSIAYCKTQTISSESTIEKGSNQRGEIEKNYITGYQSEEYENQGKLTIISKERLKNLYNKIESALKKLENSDILLKVENIERVDTDKAVLTNKGDQELEDTVNQIAEQSQSD